MANYTNLFTHSHETGNGRYSQIQTCTLTTPIFDPTKGIAALNMILNNLSVNTKIISANDHESHHGIGLAYNGIAGIIPDTISTDTAGTNSVNFLLYDLLDIQFAPCYKSFNERTLRLRGSKPSKHYKDFLIKPSKTFDKKNIIEQWPEMQKILAAFLMGRFAHPRPDAQPKFITWTDQPS